MSTYKFTFADESIDLPFKYQTVNDDKTRTPIDLTGKRLTIGFLKRGLYTPILLLDSNEDANGYGSSISINADQTLNGHRGEFNLTIPLAQSMALKANWGTCFGDWVLQIYEGDQPRDLARGPFSVA